MHSIAVFRFLGRSGRIGYFLYFCVDFVTLLLLEIEAIIWVCVHCNGVLVMICLVRFGQILEGIACFVRFFYICCHIKLRFV